MSFLLAFWLTASAVAGDAPTYAGLALETLPSLGLGEPDLAAGEDAWQAPLQTGGFVRYWWAADAAHAHDVFALQSVASTQRALPAQGGWDEAVGDGTGLVVLRTGNVVLLVRDVSGHADDVAKRLVTALDVTPVHTTAPVDGRDPYGRLP